MCVCVWERNGECKRLWEQVWRWSNFTQIGEFKSAKSEVLSSCWLSVASLLQRLCSDSESVHSGVWGATRSSCHNLGSVTPTFLFKINHRYECVCFAYVELCTVSVQLDWANKNVLKKWHIPVTRGASVQKNATK